MTNVELIIAALAAGAGVGAKDTAAVAVRDAYDELKRLLRPKLNKAAAVNAIDTSESRPDELRAAVGQELSVIEADKDEAIVAAARRLLEAAGRTASVQNIEVRTNHGAVGTFNESVTFNQGGALPPVPPEAP
ncbi:hypothetical protein ACTI_75500 [Actinoplanes sp. OR16]|uniref:hypothetical protein n=1 Tax=Actinoplanes sp. OR16 TaxID=946334 RepID=UPI000F6D4052|nr:hypothetical protein [Actinoplanes sp. OR16]BBH70865.1 hypothetical protein ACTI_75500 [Actinoplanes sp. OR16]